MQTVKVARCPRCTSESLANPSDYVEVAGRVVLQDSQTYRGHQWYSDSGDPYVPPAASAAKPVPAASPSA